MKPIVYLRTLPRKLTLIPTKLAVIPERYRSTIREKAINKARTRIVVAGGNPAQFEQNDLEVVVKEEEDKIKASIREKGLLAVLALFGLNIFG